MVLKEYLCWITTLAALGNLLDMKILLPLPGPLNQKFLGGNPGAHVVSLPYDSDAHASLRTTALYEPLIRKVARS